MIEQERKIVIERYIKYFSAVLSEENGNTMYSYSNVRILAARTY